MNNQFKQIISIFLVAFACCQTAYPQTIEGGLGVSINIDTQSKFPFIVEVTKGMPAEKMNLATNDYITKINGLSTHNYSAEQVASQLKGLVGTTCSITIWRNNVEYPLTFVRAELPTSRLTIYNNGLPEFTDFTWSGSNINGYPDGYGTLQLIKDNKKIDSYTGTMKSGRLEGKGVYYDDDGNKLLEGQFSNNRLNGSGIRYFTNGEIKFEGYFENDKLYNLEEANNECLKMAQVIVDELFDGGTKIQGRLVSVRRLDKYRPIDKNNKLVEIKINFNGNIIKSNYYELSILLKYDKNGSSYEIIKANDMVVAYGLIQLSFALGKLNRELESLRNK